MGTGGRKQGREGRMGLYKPTRLPCEKFHNPQILYLPLFFTGATKIFLLDCGWGKSSQGQFCHLRATRVSLGGPCVFPSLPISTYYQSQLQAASHNLTKVVHFHSYTEADVVQTSSCSCNDHLGATSCLPVSLGHRCLGRPGTVYTAQGCSADIFSINGRSWGFISQN